MLSRVDYVAVKCKPQFYNNKNVYDKNQGVTFIFYWLGYAVGTSYIFQISEISSFIHGLVWLYGV